MNALAKVQVQTAPTNDASNDVLIHVRFKPDADVFTIDARPDNVEPRDWFNRLYAAASQHYQVLAGGRGFFRIPRDTFQAIATQPAR
ncbi:MAG TPA: hypothetical protein VIQ05_25600 [Tardiphaga sp.]